MTKKRSAPPRLLVESPPHIRILAACKVLTQALENSARDLELCPACLAKALSQYLYDKVSNGEVPHVEAMLEFEMDVKTVALVPAGFEDDDEPKGSIH